MSPFVFKVMSRLHLGTLLTQNCLPNSQIKLKLEKSKEDRLAEANRAQLLAFLNSSTGDM